MKSQQMLSNTHVTEYSECGSDYIIRTDQKNLSFKDLQSITKNETRVIQVHSVANKHSCEVISEGMRELGFKPYINVDNVRRIGMAYYETKHQPELIEKYFSVAKENMENFRRLCESVGSPLDTSRCLLDEI